MRGTGKFGSERESGIKASANLRTENFFHSREEGKKVNFCIQRATMSEVEERASVMQTIVLSMHLKPV